MPEKCCGKDPVLVRRDKPEKGSSTAHTTYRCPTCKRCQVVGEIAAPIIWPYLPLIEEDDGA